MWNVGVYIRLSQEDGDKEESNSVINQREIITSFVKENSDLKLFDYYIDDGYSGTNFDRPGFKRLLEDIENVNEAAGCERVKIVTPDGPANYIRQFVNQLDEEEYEMFYRYHLATCERADLLGAAAHTLDIIRK